MCRWRSTYCWKALNEGYNFGLELTSIKGLHTKLWPSKVAGIPIVGISGLPLGSLETKWHLGFGPMAKHRVYYKGGRWCFPQVRAMVSLVSPFCPWLVRAPEVLQLCTNQLVVWFVQVHVSKWTAFRNAPRQA